MILFFLIMILNAGTVFGSDKKRAEFEKRDPAGYAREFQKREEAAKLELMFGS